MLAVSAAAFLLGKASSSDAEKAIRVPKLTQSQHVGYLTSLDIYVDASEFSHVWDSPMHLSSFQWQDSVRIQIHVLGADVLASEVSSSLQTSLLLAGLVPTGERKDRGAVVMQAQKRAADVRLQAKPLMIQDEDTLMIDENDLLDDNILAPPPAMKATNDKNDDCGGREPCDDCTCGRAGNKKPQEQQQSVKTSACGKCGLGDAFRCASCPYLGKPAFKPGEEHLVLDLTDDF